MTARQRQRNRPKSKSPLPSAPQLRAAAAKRPARKWRGHGDGEAGVLRAWRACHLTVTFSFAT
eukprot:scaffold10416_cov32-Tisochrysis_lutea.AAC.5